MPRPLPRPARNSAETPSYPFDLSIDDMGTISTPVDTAVVQGQRPRREALRREQLEAPRGLEALEQGRAMAGEHRVDDEPVFIDEPHSFERGREHVTADEDAARGVLLQLGHG